jgi:hypothetical protein
MGVAERATLSAAAPTDIYRRVDVGLATLAAHSPKPNTGHRESNSLTQSVSGLVPGTFRRMSPGTFPWANPETFPWACPGSFSHGRTPAPGNNPGTLSRGRILAPREPPREPFPWANPGTPGTTATPGASPEEKTTREPSRPKHYQSNHIQLAPYS